MNLFVPSLKVPLDILNTICLFFMHFISEPKPCQLYVLTPESLLPLFYPTVVKSKVAEED